MNVDVGISSRDRLQGVGERADADFGPRVKRRALMDAEVQGEISRPAGANREVDDNGTGDSLRAHVDVGGRRSVRQVEDAQVDGDFIVGRIDGDFRGGDGAAQHLQRSFLAA